MFCDGNNYMCINECTNRHLTISVLVFKSTIISILTWKLFPYLTVCATRQGVALRTAKMVPQQACELSVCNWPKELIFTFLPLNVDCPVPFTSLSLEAQRCYLQNVLIEANVAESGMKGDTVLFSTNFAHHFRTSIDLFAALTFLGFCCSNDRTVGTRAPCIRGNFASISLLIVSF